MYFVFQCCGVPCSKEMVQGVQVCGHAVESTFEWGDSTRLLWMTSLVHLTKINPQSSAGT
jgi:hypothetical protein